MLFRSVAVGDDDLVALLDETEEGVGGVAHGLDLLDGVVAPFSPITTGVALSKS